MHTGGCTRAVATYLPSRCASNKKLYKSTMHASSSLRISNGEQEVRRSRTGRLLTTKSLLLYETLQRQSTLKICIMTTTGLLFMT
jgi:hypothetical protein